MGFLPFELANKKIQPRQSMLISRFFSSIKVIPGNFGVLWVLVRFEFWWHFSWSDILLLVTFHFRWCLSFGDIWVLISVFVKPGIPGYLQLCPVNPGYSQVPPGNARVHPLRQGWENIIKWTHTKIQIYLDATLCTK